MVDDKKMMAVDFDGTIHDSKHPVEGRKMGPPMKDAVEALDIMKRRGYKVVVFCFWADSERNIKVITDWLNYYKCPFDEVTNIKPNAVAYIDDKAIKFTDWEDVLEELFL